MNSRFNYLLEKTDKAPFTARPFKHIKIFDFLDDADFEEIIQTNEISC